MFELLIEIQRLPPRKLRSACRRVGLSDLDIVSYCIGEYNDVINAGYGRRFPCKRGC